MADSFTSNYHEVIFFVSRVKHDLFSMGSIAQLDHMARSKFRVKMKNRLVLNGHEFSWTMFSICFVFSIKFSYGSRRDKEQSIHSECVSVWHMAEYVAIIKQRSIRIRLITSFQSNWIWQLSTAKWYKLPCNFKEDSVYRSDIRESSYYSYLLNF